jgi:CubicO group peptidase (beta-lactamase class C family)
MIRSISVIFLLLILSRAIYADEFTTLDGQHYPGAILKRVEPDGIVIFYTDGVVKLPFRNLPQEVRQKYAYDPQQEKAYLDRLASLNSAPITNRLPALPVTHATSTPITISSNSAPVISFDEKTLFAPKQEGFDESKLLALAEWVKSNPQIPIYSLLISKNNHLVFELYTGRINRDCSHYLMSVTKSFLSTLIGIAVDKGFLKGENLSIASLIPPNIVNRIYNPSSKSSIYKCTLKDIMGMSALNIKDPPRDNSSAAINTQQQFLAAQNRFIFCLNQKFFDTPGSESIYNDETPVLASGLLSYNSHLSALDFAKEHLFLPLGFKNYEWMHQDPSGINMGGYGLRVRPIDMQKLGMLFLNSGIWNGEQIISKDWIEKTKHPYTRLNGSLNNNYGFFWWNDNLGSNFIFQVANGWRGQRIAINYDKKLVVTMTGCIMSGEEAIFLKVLNDFVLPSLDNTNPSSCSDQIQKVLNDIMNQAPRYSWEPRMTPSVELKERHVPFSGH